MEIIRDLKKEDIDAVLNIMSEFSKVYSDSYRNSEKRGGMRWLLEYTLAQNNVLDARCLVLELDGKVIGHVAYLKDVRCFEGGVYEIQALVVDKDYQEKGHGKKLMEEVIEVLRRTDARLVWLQTEMSKGTHQYYKEFGFQPIATYQDYWGAGIHRCVLGRYLNTTKT